jgi:hydrogenase maturation protein HypF
MVRLAIEKSKRKTKRKSLIISMSQTYKIQIKGRVQGVGFRPFVYNLAKKHGIKGSVSNNEDGVIIYCKCSKEEANLFLEQILKNQPPVAVITSHSIEKVSNLNFDDFLIASSEKNTQLNLPLTPDFAICNACKTEIHSTENRRYAYAFTTCVHCGPRYAITQDFPFERDSTSLCPFEMCDTCQDEYTNPADRRFHSQTNSCKSCGIKLELVSNSAEIISTDQQHCISQAVEYIKNGNILAVKNTNGFLLCCDASNPEAIDRLRKRKQRPKKPFAVMYPDLESVQKAFKCSESEAEALQSGVAPIVILKNTKSTSIAVKAIAPHLQQTGVMLPSSALLELLMTEMKLPLVATSGNIHGSPILSDQEEAQGKLKDVADYFLHHDLDINFPQDDSVLRYSNKNKIILRRSRGLAPNYINAKTKTDSTVLAMGADLKSTFTFVPNAQTYVSQYFGNLGNYDVLHRYKATISQYIKMFEAYPQTILLDKHSAYQSTVLGHELALKWKVEVKQIQHHKAHFASVLGEHELFSAKEKILGVVWDGTGLGDDNHIWGGEFFSYQNHTMERLSHIEYFDWLANDKMAKEPRIALFCLLNNSQENEYKHKFSNTEWSVYKTMLQSNTLKTSSIGRLFDAVASALDITDYNTYEAEASMRLENCADSYTGSDYIDFLREEDFNEIPSQYLVNTIISAYKSGIKRARIAGSFVFTLAKSILKMAKKHSFETIACSGGVFQNALLVSMLQDMTNKEGINLKLNCKLSPNDENLSFGQLMYNQNIKN